MGDRTRAVIRPVQFDVWLSCHRKICVRKPLLFNFITNTSRIWLIIAGAILSFIEQYTSQTSVIWTVFSSFSRPVIGQLELERISISSLVVRVVQFLYLIVRVYIYSRIMKLFKHIDWNYFMWTTVTICDNLFSVIHWTKISPMVNSEVIQSV